ncbi:GNAT family N-acetyltransferase [Clostridium sp.]|uniref:GNAT family N-acetyltransferase n=1 Tax=Clostridium sp. TaxID=1506 RepID=UPI0039F4DC04
MEILNINEYDIDIKLEKKISDLLVESFGEIYPKDRIYYKQLPHFRFLAFDKDNLVGQVGLDYRVMNLNGVAIKVLGIIDICVKNEYRGKGIGSKLLEVIECFSVEHQMDFLLLFTDVENFYKKNGFVNANVMCKWIKIHEHKIIGIGEEEFKDKGLMIKKVGNKVWKDGNLDMLGYLY